MIVPIRDNRDDYIRALLYSLSYRYRVGGSSYGIYRGLLPSSLQRTQGYPKLKPLGLGLGVGQVICVVNHINFPGVILGLFRVTLGFYWGYIGVP